MSGFNFGQTSSTGGIIQNTINKSSVSFGQTTTLGSAGNSGFNFGKTTNIGTASISSFSLAVSSSLSNNNNATTKSTTIKPTTNFGLSVPISSTISSSGFNFPGLTTAVNINNRGLGGVDASQANEKQTTKQIKDNNIPKEILNTIVQFKEFLSNEKKYREEISRHSTKQSVSVLKEINCFKQQSSFKSSKVEYNKNIILNLKNEIRSEFQNAEMAKHTRDIPETLQYENNAPSLYFENLIIRYQQNLMIYKQQIDDLECHLINTVENTKPFSATDLVEVLFKLHSNFIGLASNLQSVHESIQILKEQYLQFIKIFKNEHTNIFEKKQFQSQRFLLPAMPLNSSNVVASILNRVQPHLNQKIGPLTTSSLSNSIQSSFQLPGNTFGLGSQNNNQSSLFGSKQNTTIATVKPFGSTNLFDSQSQLGNSSVITKQPFALQNPPLGSKRTKK